MQIPQDIETLTNPIPYIGGTGILNTMQRGLTQERKQPIIELRRGKKKGGGERKNPSTLEKKTPKSTRKRTPYTRR